MMIRRAQSLGENAKPGPRAGDPGSGSGRAPAPRAIRDTALGCLVLMSVVMLGCKLPSEPEGPMPGAVTASEAAAMEEYRAIGEAMASTGRAPRLRYVRILENYPGTRTAYEANLDLAQLDYAAIEMQRSTARTNEPVARSSQEFLDFFAYGPHAHPPMPDLQARYRAEMDPLYFKAIKNIGTWQATLEYFAAFPDSPHAPEIEASTEAALLNPNAGWEAPAILKVYQTIRPERVRELKLASKVETGLFRRLNSGTSVETLARFLQTFPGSIYAETVESMIDRVLDRKITLFRDKSELEEIIRRSPGSVDALQAQDILSQLNSQELIYQQAAATNRVSVLEEFMEANPESRFLSKAARRIEELKFAALSSGQQASLRAYEAQMNSALGSGDANLSAYQSRLKSLSNEQEAAQREARELQTKRYDLEAEAREHRRLVKHIAGQIKKINQAIKRDPSLKENLKAKQQERADHVADANRIDAEAASMAKAADAMKARAAELEDQVNALRVDARGSQVDVLERKNEVRHEYLFRLNEAWKASGKAS